MDEGKRDAGDRPGEAKHGAGEPAAREVPNIESPGEKGADEWEDQDSPIWDEEDILEPRTHRPMTLIDYLIVLMVILAFSAVSMNFLPYGVSQRYGFLDENRLLQNEELVEAATPAIVYISVNSPEGTHQGTGFNTSSEGRVLTNLHVVEGGGLIEVVFSGGQRFTVLSYTPVEGADMAWLELNSRDLPFISIEPYGLPAIGQTVTIIGNPLGFRFMAQRGQVQRYYQVAGFNRTVFDIDIAANPGNSGSPVMNDQGRACGIVFAISTVDTGNGPEARTLAIPLSGIDL